MEVVSTACQDSLLPVNEPNNVIHVHLDIIPEQEPLGVMHVLLEVSPQMKEAPAALCVHLELSSHPVAAYIVTPVQNI